MSLTDYKRTLLPNCFRSRNHSKDHPALGSLETVKIISSRLLDKNSLVHSPEGWYQCCWMGISCTV